MEVLRLEVMFVTHNCLQTILDKYLFWHQNSFRKPTSLSIKVYVVIYCMFTPVFSTCFHLSFYLSIT